MTVESDYLRSYPCFQDLTDAQLDKVAEFSVAECVFPGHTLFEDGAPGEQIYLLAKGEVEILFALGEENLALVDRLGGGQIIGCSALVPPYTYRATARSVDEIEVLIVDAAKLRELMQADNSLGFSVQQHLIQVLLDQIVDLQLGS